MAKTTGMAEGFWIDGVDLSGDVGSLSRMNNGRAVTPLTGIDKLALERAHVRRDGGMEWSTWFNTAAGQQHETLKAVTSADRIATYVNRSTLGATAFACVCKQMTYGLAVTEDGALSGPVSVESNGYGLETAGVTLTAGKRTDTGATNGTGVDFTASTNFGLQAYLHVFAFTGTDVTIKLQESSDNGAGDAFADVTGGGFTQVTSAPTKQRIQTARDLTVERYLRVVTTTSAGFTSVTFGVVVIKNTVVTNF